jgi:predicted RNase H-like HicB family nuclease
VHPENPRELGLNPPGVWLTPHAGVLVGHPPGHADGLAARTRAPVHGEWKHRTPLRGLGGAGALRDSEVAVATHNAQPGDSALPSQVIPFPPMRTFTAVIERDPETRLYVGYVPGFTGAHSQGETLDELQRNLQEVVSLLLEDGDPTLDAEFTRQAIT